MSSPPNAEELEDVLLACRYGDIDDVRSFLDTYGIEALSNARDEQQNTVLHMAAANRHDHIVEYLLPLLPTSLSAAQNASQSTPLHWATVNKHLSTIKILIEPPSPPPSSSTINANLPLPPSAATNTNQSTPKTSIKRTDLIDIKNAAGRTALGEAELADWDEGAAYLVSVMNITSTIDQEDDEGKGPTGPKEQEADEEIGPDEDTDIHVEVEDAKEKISKMSLSNSAAITS